MIKRVHQDQVQVWEDMHKLEESEDGKDRHCEYNPACNPDIIPRRLFLITSNLEKQAQKVRESVSILL